MGNPASSCAAKPIGSAKTVIVGTAGHIDHGKTALVRALTGIDTDRLPEEKKRGITIDLGFANLECTALDGSLLRISFIDVPGHARFVGNMLAGSGGIDAVLLVISAEEGVKPQTEEHLAICGLLGIQLGITVLTKMDAVEPQRLAQVRASVEQFISTTFLASEPFVAVSAFTGVGLEELRKQLLLLSERIPSKSTDFLLRLPIDRVFTMKGFGTVTTGTLMSGAVTSGQELALEPGRKQVKVRGVQVHGRSAAGAEAATRVALNLSRVETAEVKRGDTLVEPSTLSATETIDAELVLLPGAPALKHRSRIHFHAFASECMAAVSLYGYQQVEPGSRRLARLRLTVPVVLLPGDRFVLRMGSPVVTVGGGVVLDAHPVPRLKKSQALAWLQQVQCASPEEQLVLRIARRGSSGISVSDLTAETGLKPQSISAVLNPSMRSDRIQVVDSQLYMTHTALLDAASLVEQHLALLIRESGAAPIKKSELLTRTQLRPQVLDWAVEHLKKNNKLIHIGEQLLPSHADPTSISLHRASVDTLEFAYRKAGLVPPSPATLAAELDMDTARLRHHVALLLREEKLVRLGDDALCVHQNALTDLKLRVQSLRGQTLDVSQFKELAGVSRKYAIPLLEYLDRERVTRRQGSLRIVL